MSPAGKKVFRLKYLFAGKEKLFTIGAYPFFTLRDAREEAMKLKDLIAHGICPCEKKKQEKDAPKAEVVTFGSLAEDWYHSEKEFWSENYIKDQRQKLDAHILPLMGKKPILEVTRHDVEKTLTILADQKKQPTMKKVRVILSQILRHAMRKDYPVTDWTSLYTHLGRGHVVQHRACLTAPKDIAHLMRCITAYAERSLLTSLALRFSAYTFCRPGEVRHAEWSEIDYTEKLWRIPKEKMKMKTPHLVPLTTQLLALLEKLRPLSAQSPYLFPSARGRQKPMSEACTLSALRALGFTEEQMCSHGFRGTASTVLNEKGYNRDWIERQLAHQEQDKSRAPYKHTDFLQDRRAMMQEYADYLDMLERTGG